MSCSSPIAPDLLTPAYLRLCQRLVALSGHNSFFSVHVLFPQIFAIRSRASPQRECHIHTSTLLFTIHEIHWQMVLANVPPSAKGGECLRDARVHSNHKSCERSRFTCCKFTLFITNIRNISFRVMVPFPYCARNLKACLVQAREGILKNGVATFSF